MQCVLGAVCVLQPPWDFLGPGEDDRCCLIPKAPGKGEPGGEPVGAEGSPCTGVTEARSGRGREGSRPKREGHTCL